MKIVDGPEWSNMRFRFVDDEKVRSFNLSEKRFLLCMFGVIMAQAAVIYSLKPPQAWIWIAVVAGAAYLGYETWKD